MSMGFWLRSEGADFWRGFLNCRALPPLRRALTNERSKLGATAHARNATWCAEIRGKVGLVCFGMFRCVSCVQK